MNYCVLLKTLIDCTAVLLLLPSSVVRGEILLGQRPLVGGQILCKLRSDRVGVESGHGHHESLLQVVGHELQIGQIPGDVDVIEACSIASVADALAEKHRPEEGLLPVRDTRSGRMAPLRGMFSMS
jgi:hypothetical protein